MKPSSFEKEIHSTTKMCRKTLSRNKNKPILEKTEAVCSQAMNLLLSYRNMTKPTISSCLQCILFSFPTTKKERLLSDDLREPFKLQGVFSTASQVQQGNTGKDFSVLHNLTSSHARYFQCKDPLSHHLSGTMPSSLRKVLHPPPPPETQCHSPSSHFCTGKGIKHRREKTRQ